MALARSFNKLGLAALVVCAALAALVAFIGRADAQQRQQQQRQANGWQICNETSFVLEAATGRPDNRSIQVQGWTRLRPGECRLAVAAPLARGTHYLYARTSTAHRGGRRQWGGDAILCVASSIAASGGIVFATALEGLAGVALFEVKAFLLIVSIALVVVAAVMFVVEVTYSLHALQIELEG